MNVPMLDPVKANAPYQQEIEDAALRVLRSGKFIMGKEVEDFEESCNKYLGSKHSIAVSSGTDALLLSLMALGVGPGDEVICPSFTFFATAGSIARLGATPVFADVQRWTFNITDDKIKELITNKTKAIIPVHLFGKSCWMDSIMELANQHNIPVIEDACQSIGATYKDKKVGTIGTTGCFSFFPSKNLGGFGDSGLVTTNDDELADKMRMLRVHGSKKTYEHLAVGANFRIDALQAAMLNVKLKYLKNQEDKRIYHGRYYNHILTSSLQLHKFECPIEEGLGRHVFNQYTLKVKRGMRDALQLYLKDRGIGSAVYYPKPLHQQECFKHLTVGRVLTTTDMLAEEVLSIPVASELTEEQVMYVANTLCEWDI